MFAIIGTITSVGGTVLGAAEEIGEIFGGASGPGCNANNPCPGPFSGRARTLAAYYQRHPEIRSQHVSSLDLSRWDCRGMALPEMRTPEGAAKWLIFLAHGGENCSVGPVESQARQLIESALRQAEREEAQQEAQTPSPTGPTGDTGGLLSNPIVLIVGGILLARFVS